MAFNSSGIGKGPVADYGITLHNNNVYNPGGTDYQLSSGAGIGNISLDPRFVNRPSGNYHLTRESPCINSGWNSAPGVGSVDMDGQPRVQRGVIDIGADEYWQLPIDAKLAAYDQPVELNQMIVTAAFPGAFYVESDDRTSGIRVEKADHGLAVGMRASVAGNPSGNVNGERCIVATAVSQSGVGSVAPIFLTNAALGGGKLGWQEAVWGWRLVGDDPVRTWTFDVGLNNIGLLVTTTGAVKQIDTAKPAGWFIIDDGSGANVKVIVPDGVAVDPTWRQVRVTGISSCERSGVELHRTVRVRTQSDIAAL